MLYVYNRFQHNDKLVISQLMNKLKEKMVFHIVILYLLFSNNIYSRYLSLSFASTHAHTITSKKKTVIITNLLKSGKNYQQKEYKNNVDLCWFWLRFVCYITHYTRTIRKKVQIKQMIRIAMCPVVEQKNFSLEYNDKG